MCTCHHKRLAAASTRMMPLNKFDILKICSEPLKQDHLLLPSTFKFFYMKFTALLVSICMFINFTRAQPINNKPLRVGIAGLVHDHVNWILARENRGDIEITGIAEPNRALAESYAARYGYNMNLVYNSLEEMIDKTKPDAVVAFNNIFDHLKTVEYCAPRGIHVMVEKPLAVSVDHARQMIALAQKNNIHLITNYETTWYSSNRDAWKFIHEEKRIGDIRKIVFHTGHNGPAEIGCSQAFLEWLTDPVLNGGGALTDFGCYGANIATWLMKEEKPISVTAITQQIKPQRYPKVEDEATIIVTYPKTQVIIQASWNWPYGRKDMEVYGSDGYVFCLDNDKMLIMENNQRKKDTLVAAPMAASQNDPFAYFANVVNGNIKPGIYDLSSPANNLIVVQILEAAKISAQTGKTILWDEFFKN